MCVGVGGWLVGEGVNTKGASLVVRVYQQEVEEFTDPLGDPSALLSHFTLLGCCSCASKGGSV